MRKKAEIEADLISTQKEWNRLIKRFDDSLAEDSKTVNGVSDKTRMLKDSCNELNRKILALKERLENRKYEQQESKEVL